MPPQLSVDRRAMGPAVEDGRVPGIVFALSSITASLTLAPAQPPAVTVDVSTVLAEISTQLIERLLRFALAIRRIQVTEEAFSCPIVVLPDVPSPATAVSFPLSFSVWLNDVAVFVAGDLSDFKPNAPLLKLSLPLACLQLAPEEPQLSAKLHDVALIHMGEADRVIMGKQRISEVSPLLSVEHIALDVAFTDSRHVGLGVTVDRLKLDWTPAAQLSATRLVVGLAESVLLFPPMPVPPVPYYVPAVKSGPPIVLSVNGQISEVELLASFAQVSALKIYIGRLRLFESRVAHLSSGTLFMGKNQYEHLTLPSVYIFWKEAPYAGCLNLFLDGHDPCWRIPFEFDFGETLNEILIVAKAVAGATAAEIVALLDRAAKHHGWTKEEGVKGPDQPHKIILEGSLTNPRGELVDDPLQVSLANFWKISQDELVERRARLELLEQRLAALKLQLPSDAEFKALRARALAKLAEEDSRVYCQRAQLAKEQETSLLWCASSSLLHARVGIDIGDEFLTQRLLDLHRRSTCFPDENLPKWDLILGLDYRVWGKDVVNLVIRDYPLPFVQVQGPVEVHGTATFAEEVPPPSALVQYRVNVSPSFAPTCIKTLTSVKVYYDMAGVCDSLMVTLGVGYRCSVKEMGNIFALMSPESSDWCPLLPWWDKMRQVLHGQLSVTANKAVINYSGNMDPYNTKDVLEIHLERADVLLRCETLNIAAGRFGVKTASHPTFMLDAGDFEATIKWAWRTKGNPHNHWVVPNKENLADTDPIEMDVAYAGCPFRTFVPGWQEPPPATWPITDHNSEYRSQGLAWDITLVMGPYDPQRPMFTLHPSMINWFMRFGRGASFPEIWMQETVYRRPPNMQLFGSVMESLKLTLQLPHRTAFRFWEAKDPKKPLGFEVSIGELDLSIALEKIEPEPGKEKKWTLQTRPLMARNINAAVLTPEGAQRWEAAHAGLPLPYDGDFLCSIPSASLTKHVGENGVKCDHYRLESPKLQWTKDARNAVYSWLDRFHQWRITLSYSSAVEGGPASRKDTDLTPPLPRKQPPPPLVSPRGAPLSRSGTSRELESLFSEDASLPDEAREFFRSGAEPELAKRDKHFELEVIEPRIILRAEEAKGVLVFVGEKFNLQGVSSVHREGQATRELTVLSLSWIGFSAHIAPLFDAELSLASLRTQEEKCVITPCRLELGMTYSLSDTEDELEREKDANIVKINIPQLSVSLSSAQFQVLSAIINYLLLESGNTSSARDRDDQFASIMFKSQLAGGVKESLPKVRERTQRLRAELKDLEEQLTDLRAVPKTPEEELAALEREVRTKRSAYLRSDETLRGLILSQRRLRAAQQVLAKTLTFKVEVLLGRVKWSLLLGTGNNTPLADVTANRFDCVIMFYEDQSAVYRFELGDMEILNRLPHAQHRNMLQLLNPQKWTPKDVMLRLFAQQRAPVGGIFVYDHWEINLAPVNIQVSQGVYESVFEYFFPSSEEKLQEASTYDAKKKEEEEEEYDIKAKGLTDVEQMKLRARWFRSFVYIKITETEVGVTFKTLIERLRLKLHPIVYNGETWTFKELLGTLKKDIFWNLLFQAPSFVRAFTSSSGNAKEEKKTEEPAQPGALDALKRRLLLGESSPPSKGKKTERSSSHSPTPTLPTIVVPALERSERKDSEPPSLSVASPRSGSSQSPPISTAVDATPRRANSTSVLPAEAEIAALMVEFGFAPAPDAPQSEP